MKHKATAAGSAIFLAMIAGCTGHAREVQLGADELAQSPAILGLFNAQNHASSQP
ncbi:hypothetical protein GZH47_15150 [Paenibacillus rhizovicinus]|uniref:Uncharacterized protein n=1 Tax=Paenibacillus rhizovicinus TaxID=2704463 RepID=A0A6C0P0K9_9BACL|nr:hypothetical protein [Paenibacillus rhizovicinus]QHW32015.1 hypothetical protein GZH47_15150 [Paenibacillus rhizovicinus]